MYHFRNPFSLKINIQVIIMKVVIGRRRFTKSETVFPVSMLWGNNPLYRPWVPKRVVYRFILDKCIRSRFPSLRDWNTFIWPTISHFTLRFPETFKAHLPAILQVLGSVYFCALFWHPSLHSNFPWINL